ncbi:hypothetical protein CL617_01475 [archaeon]|jgi:hypothetical protein|nr:hypothetical protein [archaeon]|tara:strand:- start:7248 stop:7802 length:555 start_codon:yes stop_codon:yes gene_type:complete
MQLSINTAVDSLVNLINEKKRILLQDASKELNIPDNVIMEWSTFLEEEKIISIEYKFSKTYLVVRKKNKKAAKEEIENLKSLKNVLKRRLEYMLKFVESQDIENSGKIKSMTDIKRLLKDFVFEENNITNELVFSQKIILGSIIKNLSKKVSKLNYSNKDRISSEIEKVGEWKAIFERNLKKIK